MLIAEGSRRIALITYQALQKMPEQQRLLDLREQEFTDCPWLLKVFTGYKDRQAIKYLLASEDGRWYLNRLLESCQMGGQSFLDDEKINTMFVFEGKRKVATWLYKMLCRYGIKNWQIAKAEHRDWLAQVKLLAADDAEKNANEEYYD